jgi:predicted HAD superfamily Cof-like phosphohydrolase
MTEPYTALIAAQDVAHAIADKDLRHRVQRSLSHHAGPQQMVYTFHAMYDMPRPKSHQNLSVSRRELRLNLILEELGELIEASGFKTQISEIAVGGSRGVYAEHIEGSKQDPIEMMDALGDLVYVIYGMAIEMGLDLDSVLKEIHASNMTKLGEDGLPIMRADGKLLKGPNYMKPQLARVLGFNSGGMNGKVDDAGEDPIYRPEAFNNS